MPSDLNLPEFTFSGIASSFVFGVIGLWMFREGKRKVSYNIVFIAIGLMIYPYMTKGPLADWGVGIALCTLAYAIW